MDYWLYFGSCVIFWLYFIYLYSPASLEAGTRNGSKKAKKNNKKELARESRERIDGIIIIIDIYYSLHTYRHCYNYIRHSSIYKPSDHTLAVPVTTLDFPHFVEA